MSQAESKDIFRHMPQEIPTQKQFYSASNGHEFSIVTYSPTNETIYQNLPTVLFFPGFGMSEKGYDETLRTLSEKGYKIHFINTIPHTENLTRNADEMFAAEAKGVVEVVNKYISENGGEFVTVGNSLGGGRVLEVLNVLDHTPNVNFHILHSFLISPIAMRKEEPPKWRLYAGFTQDIFDSLRRSRLPLPGLKMNLHVQRRLIAAREDGIKNVGNHISYYAKLAVLISQLHLRAVYERHRDTITVLSAEDEKTIPPSRDTQILLPDNHFTTVTNSEELAQELDIAIRKLIQQDQ